MESIQSAGAATGTATRVPHHIQYQNVGAAPWWCDDCLSQCSSSSNVLGEPDRERRSLRAFSIALTKVLTATLASAFAILAYIAGCIRFHHRRLTALEEKWQRELNFQLLQREHMLRKLAALRLDLAKAQNSDRWTVADGIKNQIRKQEHELDKTVDEIVELEKLLQPVNIPKSEWPEPHDFFCR